MSIGGHDEREQTLDHILIETDGFTGREHVVVLAASTRGSGRVQLQLITDRSGSVDVRHLGGAHRLGQRNKRSRRRCRWSEVDEHSAGQVLGSAR